MSASIRETMTNNHSLGILARITETVHLWRQRQHGRRELLHVSERDLHDVGLSWSDALHEADKPFWRA